MYLSIYVERETGREKYLIAFKVQKTDQLTNNFTEGSIFLALFTSTPTENFFFPSYTKFPINCLASITLVSF